MSTSTSKITERRKAVVQREMQAEVSNVIMHEVGLNAETSLGGYKPDRWKAYMEFDICHSLPAVLGPVSEGFYAAYTPETLAMSHASLFNQQVNLNHILKAYEAEEGKKTKSNDKIVGCVVATFFPDPPERGWVIGTDPVAAPSIRACAVIFKLADGVNRVFGDHQASRKKQSVSIEAITTLDNIGIYLPSRGREGIVPLMELKEEAMIEALSLDPLKLGKINGEQGAFVYGVGRPVEFRGVGITPRPAEAEAKIISFQASEPRKVEGGTLIAMAAEKVDHELMGKTIQFRSGRVGHVRQVWNEGRAHLKGLGWGIMASAEDPVLEITLPNKRAVLKKLSDVAAQIQS